MTIEERKLNIALQVANNANAVLIASLATMEAENEQLKAELSHLKEGSKSP